MTSPRKAAPAPGTDAGDSSVSAGRAKRRCRVCGVAVSSYNRGPHCWRHSAGVPWRGPSAKPKYQ